MNTNFFVDQLCFFCESLNTRNVWHFNLAFLGVKFYLSGCNIFLMILGLWLCANSYRSIPGDFYIYLTYGHGL